MTVDDHKVCDATSLMCNELKVLPKGGPSPVPRSPESSLYARCGI